MAGVIRPGDMDLIEHLVRVHLIGFRHLDDTIWSERVFCVDIEYMTIQSTLLPGQLNVDAHLMCYLCFP